MSNCTPLELPQPAFPSDMFTREQRQHGAILVHIFVAVYVIAMAEHVCDEYFLTAIEHLSFRKLNMAPHVAGATVFACATSITELCASIAGVFLAKNDLSINALLGSGAYNFLVIVGLTCLCVFRKLANVRLLVYPIVRDCVFYVVSMLVLFMSLARTLFRRLYWHDSLACLGLYALYILVNVYDVKIRQMIAQKQPQQQQPQEEMLEQQSPSLIDSSSEPDDDEDEDAAPYDVLKPYRAFSEKGCTRKLSLILLAPARFAAFVLVLDYRRFQSEPVRNVCLVVTIISSLTWLAACAYILIWMATVMSETFGLTETVLGFLFIAAATGIDETVTAIVLVKREIRRQRQKKASGGSNGLDMIVSNSLGSNVFDLSIGIGLPYFINSLDGGYTSIYDQNVAYTIAGLFLCLVFFLCLLGAFRWRLRLSFGIALLTIWLVYVTLVTLIELKRVNLHILDFLIKYKC